MVKEPEDSESVSEMQKKKQYLNIERENQLLSFSRTYTTSHSLQFLRPTGKAVRKWHVTQVCQEL